MPNLIDRTLYMQSNLALAQYSNGSIPNLWGYFTQHGGSRGTGGIFGGVFYDTGVVEESGASVSGSAGRVGFDAARVSGIYSNTAPGVIPRYMSVLFMIRY